MKDIQNEPDFRKIPLNHVGVEKVRYPILLKDRKEGFQNTVGTVSMYVDLPENYRGTHMSRFIEILHSHAQNMDIRNVRSILEDMKEKLKASCAHMEMKFPYVLSKTAPVSKIESFLVIDCAFIAFLDSSGNFDFILEVNTPVQTVCPCSKAISQRGAHNQRANVRIMVKMSHMVWIEELVKVSEESASSPVFTLLKRQDEKYITENSYDNPRFVEDIAREIAIGLKAMKKITWFNVSVSSMESIHNHNALACVSWEEKHSE